MHFDDAKAAIKAAESVTGDEHTILDCQFSINLCRSLDGWDKRPSRPIPLSRATTKGRPNRGPYYDHGHVPVAIPTTSSTLNQPSPPTQSFHPFPPSPQCEPFHPFPSSPQIQSSLPSPEATCAQPQAYFIEDYFHNNNQAFHNDNQAFQNNNQAFQNHDHNHNEIYFPDQDLKQNHFQNQHLHLHASWPSDTTCNTSNHASSYSSNMIAMPTTNASYMPPWMCHDSQDNHHKIMDQFYPSKHDENLVMIQPLGYHPSSFPMPPMSFHIQPMNMEEGSQCYFAMNAEGASQAYSCMNMMEASQGYPPMNAEGASQAYSCVNVIEASQGYSPMNAEGASQGFPTEIVEGTNQGYEQYYQYENFSPNEIYYYSDENGLPVQMPMPMPSPVYDPPLAPIFDPDALPPMTPSMEAEALFHANASSPCYQQLVQAQQGFNLNASPIEPATATSTTTTTTTTTAPSRRRVKFSRLFPHKKKQPVQCA